MDLPQKITFALQILQGLLTPVIAGVAVYVAWQQWQTNRQKLALDLYARRLRLYERVVEFLDLTLRDFKPKPQDVAQFLVQVAEADFVFGPEIRVYIKELGKRALESAAAHSEYRDYAQPRPEDYNHQKVVKCMHEHELWLLNQHDVAREKFSKYLAVSL